MIPVHIKHKKAIDSRQEHLIGPAYDPRHPGLRRRAMARILDRTYAGLSWGLLAHLRDLSDSWEKLTR